MASLNIELPVRQDEDQQQKKAWGKSKKAQCLFGKTIWYAVLVIGAIISLFPSDSYLRGRFDARPAFFQHLRSLCFRPHALPWPGYSLLALPCNHDGAKHRYDCSFIYSHEYAELGQYLCRADCSFHSRHSLWDLSDAPVLPYYSSRPGEFRAH